MATERHDVGAARLRTFAWTVWSIGALCAGSAFILILATLSAEIPSRGFGFRGWVPLVALLWLSIGARIAARQPRLSVGWLIEACGFLWAVNGLFEEYATFAYFPQELGVPLVQEAVWFDGQVGAIVAGLSALALLVVPDGRLPSRRWALVAVAVVVVTVVSVAALALMPRRLVPFPFENPFGIAALRGATEPVLRSLDVARGLEVLVPTGALLLRLRAARGIQRQQLKWVAFPAVFTAITVFLYVFVDHPVVQYAEILGLVLIPVAFGIAMRQYRLYDIDLILNRTLVVGGATALLAGVYIGGIGLVQRLFILLTGETSDAAVVLTTLLVVAAFTPVHNRFQALVRRAFGSSIPGTQGLDAFTNEIAQHLRLSDRDQLLTQLLAECVDTLGAVCGRVDVIEHGDQRALSLIGHWQDDPHVVVDVRAGETVVARLLLGPRANDASYDEAARDRAERAARVVGLAIDRMRRSGYVTAPLAARERGSRG